MAITWTIKGTAGSGMDATERTLKDCGILRPVLTLASMAADVLSFEIPSTPPAGGVPDDGQTIHLYRDGVRVFAGTVTTSSLSIGARRPYYRVSTSGGWWHLDQIALTSSVEDDAGLSAERPVIGIQSGTIGSAVAAILSRARSLGSPITDGTIDAGYVLPGMTFPNMSVGSALGEVLRWHPGAMTRIDYTGTTQKLHMRLRASAPVITLDIDAQTINDGSAKFCGVRGSDITGRSTRKPTAVTLAYAERDTQGRMVYKTQSAGSGTTRRRIVAISGPELDTYLPRQEYDTALIKTTTDPRTLDEEITRNGVRGLTWPPAYASMQPDTFLTPSWAYADGRAGTPPHAQLVALGYDVPDWAVDQLGLTMTRVIYTASLCTGTYVNPTLVDGVWRSLVNGKSTPMGIDDFINSGATLAGYDVNFTQTRWWWKNISIQAVSISAAYATETTIYRSGDYDYANPPATLAANMLSASDFVPYSGQIEITEKDPISVNWIGKALNIAATAGIPSEYASAKMMVSSASHAITNGESVINVGPPMRNSFDSLVSGIRRTPQDNIYWI